MAGQYQHLQSEKHKRNFFKIEGNNNIPIKMKGGCPKIYTKQELKDHRKDYSNKIWECECCDYLSLKIASKYKHLTSEKHRIKIDDRTNKRTISH